MNRKPFSFKFCICLLLILLCPLMAYADRALSILFLHGMDLHGKWADDFNHALFTSLNENFDTRYNLHIQYLDLVTNSPELIKQYDEQLRVVLQKRHYDIVVTIFPATASFVMEREDGLFKGIPKLLVIPSAAQIEAVSGRDDYFCIASAVESNVYNTLDLITNLYPDLHRMYVVCGLSVADQNRKEMLMRAIEEAHLKTDITYLEGLPLDEMLLVLKDLPSGSVVFLLTFEIDNTGKTYLIYELTPVLCKASAVPVYTMTDALIGRGVVGGNVTNGGVYAEKTAEYIDSILGENMMPSRTYTGQINQYRFDWRELRKWDVSESKLPPESEVIFRQDSFWMLYGGYVLIGAAVLLLQAFFIIALLVTLKRRHKAESALMDSLEAQKTLTRELFHRTKNSMQMIHSFLSLQAVKCEKNKEVQKLVQDTGDRILSISLVHQKLYQSHHLSRIDFADYLKDLSQLIIESHKLPGHEIDLQFDIDDLPVLIDIAIPCGLIVTELLSNAIKYAFAGRTDGKIYIGFSRNSEKTLELKVSDDGIGTPPDFDFRKQNSLGFQIVISLAEHQLNGKISYSGKNGVRWRFLFPEELYTERV